MCIRDRHSAGTTIEGPWDEVMELIGEVHQYAHDNGYVRIHTEIRCGTRVDKFQTAQDKMDTVNKKIQNLQK